MLHLGGFYVVASLDTKRALWGDDLDEPARRSVRQTKVLDRCSLL
jgi:hypothetical protein